MKAGIWFKMLSLPPPPKKGRGIDKTLKLAKGQLIVKDEGSYYTIIVYT